MSFRIREKVRTINLVFYKTGKLSQSGSFYSDISIKQCLRRAKEIKGGILKATTTAINSTAGTRFSNPMTHALPIKLPFDSRPLQSKGARSGRSVSVSGPILAGPALYISTPLSLSRLCSPHPLTVFTPPPSPIFVLGATQEGVYRTVGSNIQVQKLLNAFFGKKMSPSTCSTSVQQGTVLCRLCNLGANGLLRVELCFLFFFGSCLNVSGITFITLPF